MQSGAITQYREVKSIHGTSINVSLDSAITQTTSAKSDPNTYLHKHHSVHLTHFHGNSLNLITPTDDTNTKCWTLLGTVDTRLRTPS
jgi:hypothetical protein